MKRGHTLAEPAEEFVLPGHNACAGCGAALAMRFVLKPLGQKTIVVVAASCWSAIGGMLPTSSLRVPTIHSPFAVTASIASGVKAGLVAAGDDETNVLAWAGDGGTFDIGLQALSAAAERNEDILFVCYDNEAYMNTGVQHSSATPQGAWTTTTPAGAAKQRPKKNIVEIIVAHRVPYAATASLAYPQDLFRKVSWARDTHGFRFLHILSPCPPGWRTATELSIKVARLAILTRVFPLYEVKDGRRYFINVMPKPLPVSAYLTPQGRFAHLGEEDIKRIQENVDREWQELMLRTKEWGPV